MTSSFVGMIDPFPMECVGSADRPEGLPHLVGEDFGLFEGREVSAPVDLVPVDEVWPLGLSPRLGSAVDLLWEDCCGHRELDAACIEPAAVAGVLPVDPRRRC